MIDKNKLYNRIKNLFLLINIIKNNNKEIKGNEINKKILVVTI